MNNSAEREVIIKPKFLIKHNTDYIKTILSKTNE